MQRLVTYCLKKWLSCGQLSARSAQKAAPDDRYRGIQLTRSKRSWGEFKITSEDRLEEAAILSVGFATGQAG